jgi:hypothetical protein
MTASSIRQRAFAAPRHGTRFFALLGVLALFGMIALATWHDALPHVHAPDHAVSIDLDHHDDDSPDKPDSPDLIHIAAHTVIQTVDVPSQPFLAVATVSSTVPWGMVPSDGIGSVKPESLLRPPRT